ncbi:TPA: hypothetical protein ACQ2HY_003299 [Klebsiella pneumoniae]
MKTVIIIERKNKTPYFINDLNECRKILKVKIKNLRSIKERIYDAKSIQTNTNHDIWRKYLLLNELQYDLVSEEEDIERLTKAIDKGE